MLDSLNGNREFLYTFNGRGLVTGLLDVNGTIAERWDHDVFGLPSLVEFNGKLGDGGITSPLGNPFTIGSGLWDADAEGGVGLGGLYDPFTGQSENPESGVGEPGCGNDYGLGGPPGLGQSGQSGLMQQTGNGGEGGYRTPTGMTPGEAIKKLGWAA